VNTGMVLKAFYETWRTTLLFAFGMAVVIGLLSFALPKIFDNYAEQLLQIDFVRRIASALLGTPSLSGLNTHMLMSFAWVHPLVLAILWSHAIAHATRVPAGELERGTADFLFAQPLRRSSILVADGLVGAAGGIVVTVAALVGHLVGGHIGHPADPPRLAMAVAIAVNLYAMFLAVSAITQFISVCCERRGRAIGLSLGMVLASFLVNFLAQLWPAAHFASSASLMHYYRPLEVVLTEEWPVANILVFLVPIALCWTAGLLVLSRRDLCTN
jgi:ABC-type transport system involved in multi-copper enzyme maturation permease subunit